MNKKQRESIAKYFYDIGKGVVLLAVVGNIVQGKWSFPAVFFGIASSIVFFFCAYVTERQLNHE
jgi:hypothetical protein